jgi:hypothetical protein
VSDFLLRRGVCPTCGARTASHRVDPVDVIVATVADETGVPRDQIRSRSRLGSASRARHEVWRRLREVGWSYPAIGAAFGVDHTSVMYGVKRATVGFMPRKTWPTAGLAAPMRVRVELLP